MWNGIGIRACTLFYLIVSSSSSIWNESKTVENDENSVLKGMPSTKLPSNISPLNISDSISEDINMISNLELSHLNESSVKYEQEDEYKRDHGFKDTPDIATTYPIDVMLNSDDTYLPTAEEHEDEFHDIEEPVHNNEHHDELNGNNSVPLVSEGRNVLVGNLSIDDVPINNSRNLETNDNNKEDESNEDWNTFIKTVILPGTFRIADLKQCSLPHLTTSICKNPFPTFYFDKHSNSCLPFQYDDCTQERNTFPDAKSCYMRCHPQTKILPGTVVIAPLDLIMESYQTEEKVLTFDGTSNIRYDIVLDKRKPIQLSFNLRTFAVDGDIISLIEENEVEDAVQIYTKIIDGKFAVEYLRGNDKTLMILKLGGIQEGAWNAFLLMLDLGEGKAVLEVNTYSEKFDIQPIEGGNSSRISTYFQLWMGGLPPRMILESGCRSAQTPLSGCLKKAVILNGENYFALLTREDFLNKTALLNVNVGEECLNRCKGDALGCADGYSCMDTFSAVSCTNYDISDPLILNLIGQNYISYRVNGYIRKRETFTNTFSLSFKTTRPDAILLYVTGTSRHNTTQFLSLVLTAEGNILLEAQIQVETISALLGKHLADDKFHNVTVIQNHGAIFFSVDGLNKTLEFPTKNTSLSYIFHPYMYIGGAANINADCKRMPQSGSKLPNCETSFTTRHYYNVSDGACDSFTSSGCSTEEFNNFKDGLSCLEACYVNGLRSYNFFAGCLKEIYINGIDVLAQYDEIDGSQVTLHNSALNKAPIGRTCKNGTGSIIFTMENDILMVNRKDLRAEFELQMSFLSNGSVEYTVASGFLYLSESQYSWELRVLENDVSFTISELSLNVTLYNVINNNHSNKIQLISDGKNISLTSGNISTGYSSEEQLLFDYSVTFGKAVEDTPGLVGCVNHILIDGEEVDTRQYVGSSSISSGVVLGYCEDLGLCERRSCPGHSQCFLDDGVPSCQCPKSTTPQCFFEKYRRSCLHYNLAGFNSSGTYEIDIDGPGSKKPQRVHCDFSSSPQRSAKTAITHNLPRDYVVHLPESNSFKIDVSYRDFSVEDLKNLVQHSSNCSQTVKLFCPNSTTDINSVPVMSSPWIKDIASVESAIFKSCACSDNDAQTASNVTCNRDGSNGSLQTDQILITDNRILPITAFTFKGKSQTTESQLQLSLGNLECWNEIHSQSAFMESESSYIEVPAWTEGVLSFSFRTSSSSGILFYQPSLYHTQPSIFLNIISEHKVEFQFRNEQEELTKVLHIDSALKSGEWHFIWLDTSSDVIRLILDKQEHFLMLKTARSLTYIHEGSSYIGLPIRSTAMQEDVVVRTGFVGCIKNLIVNNEVIDLAVVIQTSSRGVSPDCQSSCDFAVCHNEGICIEKWDSYECICQNPYSQHGKNCEVDFNDDAVRFRSSDTEIFYYEEEPRRLTVSPLTGNLTFNFRTNQKSAMLLVARDHIQNIIQIYLESSTKLTVLFSYGDTIRNLSVDTKDTVLSEGQSVQVAVSRGNIFTKLIVFTRGKKYYAEADVGYLLLAESEYEQFPFEVSPSLVQYQHSLTVPSSFFLLFLGGVKSAGMETKLPGLIGCFRGLAIDGELISLSDQTGWTYGPNIDSGCSTLCDEATPCKNDGRCLDDFSANDTYKCDCSTTSFTGDECNEEIGYYFSGDEWLGLEEYSLEYNSSFIIDFAFSLNDRNVQADQLLLAIRLVDFYEEYSHLLVFIEPFELIRIEFIQRDISTITKCPFSSNPVERQYLRIVRNNNNIFVNLNGKERDISYEKQMTDTISFEGGLLVAGGNNDTLLQLKTDRFEGCISNLRLHSSNILDFWPLSSYQMGDNFLGQGMPKLGSCGYSYGDVKALPAFFELQPISPWAYPEPQIVPLNSATEVEELEWSTNIVTTAETETTEEPDNTIIWPFILLSVMVGLLLIAGFALCLYKDSKKHKKREEHTNQRENATMPIELTMLEREPSVLRSQRSEVSQEGRPLLQAKTVEMQPMMSASQEPLLRSAPEADSDTTEKRRSPPPPYTEEPIRQISTLAEVTDSNNTYSMSIEIHQATDNIRHIDSSEDDSHEGLKSDAKCEENNPHPSAPPVESIAVTDEEASTNSLRGSFEDVSEMPEPHEFIVDLQTYHLKRQASKPPNLPPKSKH